MIESQIFRQSGVGSRAWYIHRIKIGFPAGKTGFTYLRADSGDDGKQLSFDEIKSSMSQLVAAGYVKKHGKPDAPRSDKYEVTSFGHRYLEEHKSELEQKPEPKATGAAQTGVEHHVPKFPQFKPSPPSVIVPPAPERPIDRVAKAGITLGQEIEKHKAATLPGTNRPLDQSHTLDDPEPISAPAPENSPAKEQGSDTPSGLKTDTPAEISPPENTNLVDQIYSAMGDMLLDKYKARVGMSNYVNISVYDLIDYLEKKK